MQCVCLQAKLTATPHRRRDNQSSNLQEARDQEEPEGPGERIGVDHIVARDAPTDEDEVVSLVCRDRFSGVVWTYPALSKDSEEVEDALRHFCGRKSPIVSVASDRAPEILKAIRDIGFNSEPAVPRDPLHNPFAESAIRTIKKGTATLLLQSGLHVRHWKFAQRCFAFKCNATLEPPKAIQELAKEKGQALSSTRFEAHWKYPYEGYLIPFGALVWYKEREAGTFAPKGEPALYLGPEVVDGMRFKGAHQVVTLRSLQDGGFRVVITKDLAVPNGKWSFPLAKAKALDEENPHHKLPSTESLAPPAGALDESIEQQTPGKPRVDEVGPKAEATRAEEASEKFSRNRAITKLRLAVHGKTPKCDGCRTGSYNHNKACRTRFNDLLDFHEPLPAKDKEDEELEDAFVPPEESEVPAFTLPSTAGEEVGETVSGLAACVELLADPKAHQTGELTEEVAQQLFQGLPQETTVALTAKERRSKVKQSTGVTFVEFCCSSNSQLRRVCEQHQISYLGLSKDFVDLEDQQQFLQVLDWARDQAERGEVLHLWGSLPSKPWHNLRSDKDSKHVDTPTALEREHSLRLVKHFVSLASVAVESGGSVSFEWPKSCSGWYQSSVLDSQCLT